MNTQNYNNMLVRRNWMELNMLTEKKWKTVRDKMSDKSSYNRKLYINISSIQNRLEKKVEGEMTV